MICLTIVAGFSILSIRLVHLQWLDRHESVTKASRSYTRERLLPARSGLIVDRNEEIIARNMPVSTIVVDKYHLRDPKIVSLGVACQRLMGTRAWIEADELGRRKLLMAQRRKVLEEMAPGDIVQDHLSRALVVISRSLRIPSDELRSRIEGSKLMEVVVAKDLPEDVADEIEETIGTHRLQGFRFEKRMHRWYSASKLATHTVGFVNHEGAGVCGVERTMGDYLRGKDGYRILKRGSRGFLLAPHEGKLKPPIAGFNVQLSLDLGLQAIVEEELDSGLAEFEAERGAVIMMAPGSGDVLAIASRPHFDLNDRAGVADASFHYAVQALYEPGSTFKVVAATGVLDAGLMSPSTVTHCHWGMLQESHGVRVPDHHPYGDLTLEEVLMKSSNIGAYKIAKRLGRPAFLDYLDRFGFAQRTGIALPGESAGLVSDATNAVNFSRLSYGYGISVTPLQVAAAYGAIANGGTLMKPRLVQAVIANDGTAIESYGPESVGKVMSGPASRRMRAALSRVVSKEGTASRAAVPGFKSAGKTGTAKKTLANGRGYHADRYVVSFAGMLPADEPEFVCVVVIDDPQTTSVKRSGGTIGAPIFANIAARAAAYLNLEPTEPVELEDSLASSHE
ncbi:MAG: penicillin-binding protein 2 [Akkermansiaceae bacterium]|nr:penicillin-binding protein 2 [Akkermansiaceae bacterium]NNM30353.1 penicillin-binding protein 2 [Akkermansiaceae bacterium]